MTPEIDITALRKRLGVSQDKFAAMFGFSAKTIRNWEQGVRTPEGPARILLKVIENDPEAVLRAIQQSPNEAKLGVPCSTTPVAIQQY